MSSAASIKRISDLIVFGTAKLNAVSDTAKLDTQLILAHTLTKTLTYLHTWPDSIISDIQYEQFIALLARRELGEPVAYIIGKQDFWTLTLAVSPATLIPRSDTEVMVESVLDYSESLLREPLVNKPIYCLDLGTGTGAIALALASERSAWNIEAIDFNEEAVALAKLNAKTNDLNQVNIYQSDWFSNVKHESFDIIVSNPPYIDAQDHHLNEGDVRFEPDSALIAKKNGLADILHITSLAKNFLAPQGALFFEHGFEQAQAVQSILAKAGFQNIVTVKDYAHNDRITWAIKSGY